MKNRSAALSFIFITVLIDVIGFGIIIPVMPQLIRSLSHGSMSEAAQNGGWLIFSYAFTQFLFSPILGNLSDQYGRRPVLLFSLLGFGIDYIFLIFAPTLSWLFVGRIIAGITGASWTTASAYVADVSTPENRAQNYGMIGAAFGIGFIIGPAIGGLLSSFGLRAPFVAAAILTLINWLYGYFVLPESLSLENRRKFNFKTANPLSSLLRLKRYPAIIGLIVAFFLLYLAAQSVQSTWSYINIEKFKWNGTMVGLSLTMVGVMVAIVQGILIRKVIPILGQQRAVFIGLVLYGVGQLLFGFASQGWMMFVFTIIYCLGGISGPALQGIISSHIPPNEQGELQGALTSLMSASAIIGPLMMTNLFAYFTKSGHPYLPGIPFLLGALLLVFSAVIAYISMKKDEKIKES